MMNLIVRGYGDGELIFQELVSLPGTLEELATMVGPMAQRQVDRLSPYELHMVEFEFLDEPDRNRRFLRFGTDPRSMVKPMVLPIRTMPWEQ